MTSQGRSTPAVIIILALVSSGLVSSQAWRASAQAPAAGQPETKAKTLQEAAARVKAAKAAKEAAKQEAAAKEAQARQEAEARAAQARAAAAAKGEPVALDLAKCLVHTPQQFLKMKRYPWAVTPVGKQTIAGVPVEIQGATILWGKRNADLRLKYPETFTDIPIQQKFETLYVLHCVFFEAAKGEPSFAVVINSEGGEKQSDEILCGDDSKDWWINDPNEKVGPDSKRSTLGWKGTGKANGRDQDVRFCMTAIENKHPERLVTTLDLVSSKKQAAGVILAITLGKSGLLKPIPEKPAESGERKEK